MAGGILLVKARLDILDVNRPDERGRILASKNQAACFLGIGLLGVCKNRRLDLFRKRQSKHFHTRAIRTAEV